MQELQHQVHGYIHRLMETVARRLHDLGGGMIHPIFWVPRRATSYLTFRFVGDFMRLATAFFR